MAVDVKEYFEVFAEDDRLIDEIDNDFVLVVDIMTR